MQQSQKHERLTIGNGTRTSEATIVVVAFLVGSYDDFIAGRDECVS